MGRGRAKAKQVKVARQLKYNSGGTDLDRLRAELGVVTDQQDAESEAAYAELGIGYLPAQTFQGYSGATLWSQEFGLRTPVAAAATAPSTGKPAAKPKPKKKPAHVHRSAARRIP